MSLTRLICEGCGFTLVYCRCEQEYTLDLGPLVEDVLEERKSPSYDPEQKPA